MAEHRSQPQRPLLTQEELKKKFEISNFDLNAILRGAQLTVVGALRALQNPRLFTSEHYKQAAIAVAAGIAIRIIVEIPIIGIKVLLWFLSFFINSQTSTWDDKLVNGLNFIQNYVLQVPFFLMMLMRHITPTLDNMFMDSLAWVDRTYVQKHRNEDPANLREMYYPNLRKYDVRDGSTHSRSTAEALTVLLMRLGRKAGISLAIFGLSYVPVVGRLVLPAASFYTFNRAVGLGPAAIIFGTGVFLPRRYLVIFLQSYFTSRSLMRELLEPYFSRIKFTKEERRNWFHDREGLLFGFAVGFYIFLRIPLLGVLIYGIAEASTGLNSITNGSIPLSLLALMFYIYTAYLITKITDPPPDPAHSQGFAASQQQWKNKHAFLKLDLSHLDAPNISGNGVDQNPTSTGIATFSAVPDEPPPPYTEFRER